MFFEYDNTTLPTYIKLGNHAQYILPIAQKVCTGNGIDIGGQSVQSSFPGAQICDLTQEYPWNDALQIPVEKEKYDFVFSSHCLEHIPDYITALLEWIRVLKSGGTLFLYLPSIECAYWRPINNRKHIHILYPADLEYDLKRLGIKHIQKSGIDLAYSWAIFGVKE